MAKETRTRILDAALDVVARQGYETTTVEDVAQRAQLSRQNLYYHFRDKRDLFAEAVQRFFDLFQDQILAESFDRVDDPIEAVARCGERLDRGELSPGLSVRLSGAWVFGTLHADSGELGDVVKVRVTEVILGWTVKVEEALSAGVERRILVPETPVEPAARFCVSSWEGAVILSRGRDQAPYLTDTNRMLGLFLSGYRQDLATPPLPPTASAPGPSSLGSSAPPLSFGPNR